MIIFVHFYFPFSVHCYIIIYNNSLQYVVLGSTKKQQYERIGAIYEFESSYDKWS